MAPAAPGPVGRVGTRSSGMSRSPCRAACGTAPRTARTSRRSRRCRTVRRCTRRRRTRSI